MAFTVTPASGSTPYTFEADFLNKESFNLGYSLRFALGAPLVGACPLPASASSIVGTASTALLNTGVYVRSTGSVPAGSCNVYRLDVLDANGIVIQSESVTVNNV